MNKLFALFGFLLLVACGSDNQDKNGVIPIETPEVADEATSNDEQNQDEAEGVFDEYLNVRFHDGTDTSMVFERIPMERFSRFRYRKLMLEKRDEYWVITHPDFEFKMAEVEFVPELNQLQYADRDSTIVDGINGHRMFGAGDELPKTEFARLTFTPNGGDLKNIPEPVTHDLYNINLGGEGRNGNPQAYVLMNGVILMTLKGGTEGDEYMAMFMFDSEGELMNRRVEVLPQREETEEGEE